MLKKGKKYFYPPTNMWIKFVTTTKSLIDDSTLYCFTGTKGRKIKSYVLSEEDIKKLLTYKQIYYETTNRRTEEEHYTGCDFDYWGTNGMADKL